MVAHFHNPSKKRLGKDGELRTPRLKSETSLHHQQSRKVIVAKGKPGIIFYRNILSSVHCIETDTKNLHYETFMKDIIKYFHI